MIVNCPSCKGQIEIPHVTPPPPAPKLSVPAKDSSNQTKARLSAPAIPALADFPVTAASEAQYWLEREGSVRGPYSFEILAIMWARKELRLTDHLRKDGTESWIEVTRVVKSLDKAAHAQSDKSRNPPSFGFVIFLSALLPIIGLIMGGVWLSQPRFRSAGGALLAISVIFMLIWCAILFH